MKFSIFIIASTIIIVWFFFFFCFSFVFYLLHDCQTTFFCLYVRHLYFGFYDLTKMFVVLPISKNFGVMMGSNTIANRICNYDNYGNDCGLFYNLFYALSCLEIKADSFDIFDCIPINVIFDKRFANKENDSIEHIKITILNLHACVEEDEWIRNFANNCYGYFVKDCENSIENIIPVNRLILSSNTLYPTLIQSLRGNFRSFDVIWCSEQLLITKENVFAIFHNYLECFRMDAAHTVKFDIDLKELEQIIEEKNEFLEDGEIRLLNCPKFQQLSLRCTNSKEEDLYQIDLCKNIETLCVSDIWCGRNTRQLIDFENGWFMNEIGNSNSNSNRNSSLKNLRSGHASELKHIKICITKDGTQRDKISLQTSGLILKRLIIMKNYFMSNRYRAYEDSTGIESTDKSTNKNVSFRVGMIGIVKRGKKKRKNKNNRSNTVLAASSSSLGGSSSQTQVYQQFSNGENIFDELIESKRKAEKETNKSSQSSDTTHNTHFNIISKPKDDGTEPVLTSCSLNLAHHMGRCLQIMKCLDPVSGEAFQEVEDALYFYLYHVFIWFGENIPNFF